MAENRDEVTDRGFKTAMMKSGIRERALTPCPDCEHLCSVEALSCPNCGKPLRPEPDKTKATLDDSINNHILNQSSMKVGMCLTLLGLIKVVEGVKNVKSVVDELLAIDALAFLISSIVSYYALKQMEAERKRKASRVGDLIFTGAIFVLIGVCAILAFELL